jgi:cupin fold WbuC family metalloprotein
MKSPSTTESRDPCWIGNDLLDAVSAQARSSPRLRRNRNFHEGDDSRCHRLLNAIEPDSYIRPHRHLDPEKAETIVVVRGRIAVVFFSEDGRETESAILEAGGPLVGVNVAPGRFHSLIALTSGSVFFESKAGPYRPLDSAELARWAPEEGAEEAGAYRARLVEHLSGKP